MLGTKSLPMVTMFNGALFESHTKLYWFYFAGLRLREAQFKYSENLGKFGTKLLGTKTLPMVTMF